MSKRSANSSSSPAAILAALLVLPAAALAEPAVPAASAPSESPPGSSEVAHSPSFGLAAFAGYESGDRLRGPSLRLDAELPLLKDPSPARLSLLASIAYSRRTGTWPTTTAAYTGGYWGVVEVPVTLSTLAVVPMLRSARRFGRHFTVLAELGVGVFWATREAPSDADRETSRYRDLVARFGAVCMYDVSDRLSVGPMLELTRYYGPVDDYETILAQAGALFRL